MPVRSAPPGMPVIPGFCTEAIRQEGSCSALRNAGQPFCMRAAANVMPYFADFYLLLHSKKSANPTI